MFGGKVKTSLNETARRTKR